MSNDHLKGWLIEAMQTLRNGRVPSIPDTIRPLLRAAVEKHDSSLVRAADAVRVYHRDSNFIEAAEGISVVIPTSCKIRKWTTSTGLSLHITIAAILHADRGDIGELVRHLQLGYSLNEIDIRNCFDLDTVSGYVTNQLALFAIHAANFQRMNPEQAARLNYISRIPTDFRFLKLAAEGMNRVYLAYELDEGGSQEEARNHQASIDALPRLFEGLVQSSTDQSVVDLIDGRIGTLKNRQAVPNVAGLILDRQSFNLTRLSCEMMLDYQSDKNLAAKEIVNRYSDRFKALGGKLRMEKAASLESLWVERIPIQVKASSFFRPLPRGGSNEPPLSWEIVLPEKN